MKWKFSSLKTVVGFRLLQVGLSGENSSSSGITESCKVSAELFRAAALWCLSMLLLFLWLQSPILHCVVPHTYMCVWAPTVTHRQCSFLKLYWSSSSKGFQWSKDEVRAEFNFALESPLPLLETLHAIKTVAGFRLSRELVPFHFFAPVFQVVIISEDVF